jgi:hypothetical protein
LFLGVVVEPSSLPTTATTSIDGLGATSGGFLRAEDLLWGWLLRWELEEACAAVVGFDARLLDGALIRWRVGIVEGGFEGFKGVSDGWWSWRSRSWTTIEISTTTANSSTNNAAL